MRKLYLTFSIFFYSCFLISQTLDATLLELNLHPSSQPKDFFETNNGFYFTANDGIVGRELWFSDGTDGGTYLVKDIFQGAESSNILPLNEVGNIFYFTANDGVNGREIWRTDGTEIGTYLLKNIRPQDLSGAQSPTEELIEYNDKIYFKATDNVNGWELWESDGTESGTVLFKDISPNGSSIPSSFFVFNDLLFFVADDGSNGFELWKSDGTPDGTSLFIDFDQSGNSLSIDSRFIVLGDNFYFAPSTGDAIGRELWQSDGTVSGTNLVKDINPNSFQTGVFGINGIVLGNELIFIANDGANGQEIWKTDGTGQGTQLIKNINPNFNSVNALDTEFVKVENEVFFVADDGPNGKELWKTDGTEQGTNIVIDLNPGDNFFMNITNLHESNGELLFGKDLFTGGTRSIWKTDGTPNGTIELGQGDIRPGQDLEYVNFNNQTFLSLENDFNANELFVINQNIDNISLFKDINSTQSSFSDKYIDVNGTLFFRANVRDSGRQLVKSDGSIEGTGLVSDINTANGFNSIDDDSQFAIANNELFLNAFDGVHGYELWRSDGTESGTVLVKDILPGSGSGIDPNDLRSEVFFRSAQNILYFAANNGVSGYELWKSDGTESGTVLVKDINVGSSSSFPKSFVEFNGEVYFIAIVPGTTSLWKTDGTESGTVKIIDLNDTRVLETVNNKLILVAETSGTTFGPHDLWVSDGTASGTTFLQSFGDNIDSDIQFTTMLNDELYFVAKNPISFQKSIYKTDGTLEGTVLLYDGATHPTITNIDIDTILTCGDYVYFAVQDGFGPDIEIYRTDGTVNGTTIILDLSGIDSFALNEFTCFKTSLFFISQNNFGDDLWVTNEDITQKLDINVANDDSGIYFIQDLASNESFLFFRALREKNDIIIDNELYVTAPNLNLLSFEDVNLDDDTNQLIKLYPNPTDGILNIRSLDNQKLINEIIVYDITGKVLIDKKVEIPQHIYTLNTSSVSGGIYIATIKMNDGSKESVKFSINN